MSTEGRNAQKILEQIGKEVTGRRKKELKEGGVRGEPREPERGQAARIVISGKRKILQEVKTHYVQKDTRQKDPETCSTSGKGEDFLGKEGNSKEDQEESKEKRETVPAGTSPMT